MFLSYPIDQYQIGDIADIGTGRSNRSDAVNDGQYPFYVRSDKIQHLDSYEFDEEAIIIPGEGGIGEIFHYVNGKYALHQRVYRVHFKTDRIVVKYAYHYFKANFKRFILKKAVSATVTSIRKPMIESFVICVPPIEVQKEIVRILDSFTDLTSELTSDLTSEFTARKKQYEYYRDRLLSFDHMTPEERQSLGVKSMTLGELFSFKNGLNKGKEYFGRGVPIVNFTDVYNKKRLFASSLNGRVDVNPEEIDRYSVSKGDVFFTRTSETKEDIGMASVMVDDIKDCVFSGFVLRARPITSFLLPEYCSYCFSTKAFREEIIRYSSYTTRALTSGGALSKLVLTFPSLEEQKRIVGILDMLDSFCNDMNNGLLAEIMARQKQYAYYRDKLLSFEVT